MEDQQKQSGKFDFYKAVAEEVKNTIINDADQDIREGGSWYALPRWFLRTRQLTPAEKAVFALLMSYRGNEEQPGQREMREMLGLGANTLVGALKGLEAKMMLLAVPSPGEKPKYQILSMENWLIHLDVVVKPPRPKISKETISRQKELLLDSNGEEGGVTPEYHHRYSSVTPEARGVTQELHLKPAKPRPATGSASPETKKKKLIQRQVVVETEKSTPPPVKGGIHLGIVKSIDWVFKKTRKGGYEFETANTWMKKLVEERGADECWRISDWLHVNAGQFPETIPKSITVSPAGLAFFIAFIDRERAYGAQSALAH